MSDLRITPIPGTESSALAARVIARYSLAGVSGGSALVTVGERLLAVHDDAFRVTWISLPALELTPLVLLGDGASLAKADKPDFEAAAVTADGLLHVLGSGSTNRRCTVARVDPRTSQVELLERPEIYACIEDVLALDERPNIEGAIIDGERLRLFHRGIRTPSASVDLPLGVLYGEAPRVLAAHAFDLGTLDGIRLSVTDAAALPGERTAFAATAEDTMDAVLDGPVAGSVIGVVEGVRRSRLKPLPQDGLSQGGGPQAEVPPGGRPRGGGPQAEVPPGGRPPGGVPRGGGLGARWTRVVDAEGRPLRAKVEGLVIDGDLRAGWILTDADDPKQPACLARVVLEGFE